MSNGILRDELYKLPYKGVDWKAVTSGHPAENEQLIELLRLHAPTRAELLEFIENIISQRLSLSADELERLNTLRQQLEDLLGNDGMADFISALPDLLAQIGEAIEINSENLDGHIGNSDIHFDNGTQKDTIISHPDDSVRHIPPLAVTEGTAAALTATVPGWQEADGRTIRLRTSVAIGANATLNVNGVGARQIRTPLNTQIAANTVAANAVITLVWHNNSFFLQGVSSAGSTPNPTPAMRTTTTITASTTWTVPAGVTSIHVTLIGGGAGGYGGQGSPTTNNRIAVSGSGGSSGGLHQFVRAVTPGQAIPIVIGQGGIGSNGTPAGIAAAHGSLPTGGGTTSITFAGTQLTATGGQQATVGMGSLVAQTAFRNFSGLAGVPDGRRGGQSGYAWRRASTPGPNSTAMAGGIFGIGGDGGNVHPRFGGGGGGGNASSTEGFFNEIANGGSSLAGNGSGATLNGAGGRGGNGAPGGVIIVW